MAILVKRVYEPASPGDGFRVLVDRLWPRGLSKREARIDLWARDASPSTALRRWYDHDPDRWDEFRRRYFEELREGVESLETIRARARSGTVTLVFASRELRYNNAVALKEFLENGD